MHAMPFVVWFRPVSSDERVGEHSAVVCQLVYVSPVAARALMFGVSMRPPQGSMAENPVSSSTTYSTFGAPGGATGCRYGSQSGIESALVDVDRALERSAHCLAFVDGRSRPRQSLSASAGSL